MTTVRPIGPMMVDLRGLQLTSEERALLNEPAIGGVILFSRNFESPRQVFDLVKNIRAARSNGALIIAVDQEGGRVQRFQDGFTHLPAAARLLEIAHAEMSAACEVAREAGWLMASEVRAVDVDLSFAPVLDLNRGISTVIGDRAFAEHPDTVAQLAGAFAEGMRAAGMAAVGKHFPGHGGVAADSHLDLPVDGRSWDELWAEDLRPYQQLIPQGIEGIMPAHVVYSALDDRPAGFSSFWLQEILRTRLDFQGAIFSDDLSMQGAACLGNFAERAQAALNAGCDMVLLCNCPDEVPKVAAALADYQNSASAQRLQKLLGKGVIDGTELRRSERWQRAVARLTAA